MSFRTTELDDPDFVRFLRSTIRSVWGLELILLMRRTAPQAWTSDELVREMRASIPAIADNLVRLEASGLIARAGDERLTFSPASPRLAALADTLDRLYRDSPVRLIDVMFSPASERLQALADAFRLKGPNR